MNTIIQYFFRYPKIVGIIGLLIAAAAASLGIANWVKWRQMPSEPLHMSLSEIATRVTGERLWVSIGDGEWDYDSILYDDWKRTRVLLLDASKSILVVAVFSGRVPRDEIAAFQPEGEIYRLDDVDYRDFKSRGYFAGYGDAVSFFKLCTYCGSGNTKLGITVGAILSLFGLAMYPLSFFGGKRYR